MGTCATGLVTRGFICCDFMQDQLQSCDKPLFQSVVEVRPRVRNAATPPAGAPGTPSPVTAQELRPSAKAEAPAPAPAGLKPSSTSATVLRPKIVKAEEE